MQFRRASLIGSIDWLTVAIYLLLVIIGWVNIYSAGYSEESSSMFDLSQQYGKQILWIGMAAVLAIFTMSIDQRFFETFAFVIYGFFILLLLSVLFVGIEVNGAKSWLDFGFVRLQPAEFTKIGTALALAAWMSRYNFNLNNTRDFMLMLGIVALPMLLILLQNDMGSVLTYTSFVILFYRRGLSAIYLWMIAIAGLIFVLVLRFSTIDVFVGIASAVVLVLLYKRLWREVGLYLASAILLVGMWWAGRYFALFSLDISVVLYLLIGANALYWLTKSYLSKLRFYRLLVAFALGAFLFTSSVEKVFNLFDDYQQDRILITLGLKSDPYGVEYHVIQSLIAIGSGGFSGKGFLEGTQTKFDFVPEQTTDFIFSTIGEEFGFLGTFTVISLFLFLLIRLLFLAERQRSSFSKNYAYGLVGIIFIHFFINIGMVTGIGPVIGVPLPFVSYGGSSLWSFTLLLFIFLKMDARRMEVLSS